MNFLKKIFLFSRITTHQFFQTQIILFITISQGSAKKLNQRKKLLPTWFAYCLSWPHQGLYYAGAWKSASRTDCRTGRGENRGFVLI